MWFRLLRGGHPALGHGERQNQASTTHSTTKATGGQPVLPTTPWCAQLRGFRSQAERQAANDFALFGLPYSA